MPAAHSVNVTHRESKGPDQMGAKVASEVLSPAQTDLRCVAAASPAGGRP